VVVEIEGAGTFRQRGRYIAAVVQVLTAAGRPLTAREIAEDALAAAAGHNAQDSDGTRNLAARSVGAIVMRQ